MADFKLGRLKFKWRGDWVVSTAYTIDDIAKYGGNVYVCVENHTSQATNAGFATDLAAVKWSLHTEGLYFKDTWGFDTVYKVNDIVKYGGRQYRTTIAHTSASSGGLNQSNFELYTDGLDFLGDWVASTLYKLNDVVKYGSYQYKTITEHTSTATFDETKFNVYSEGLQWEDSYNAGTTYQNGDVVTYGGYTYVYINVTASAGNTPTDNTYWDVITTGFKALGKYSHGTAYKTGDTVQYGGNNYVSQSNNTNEYPANTNGTTNSSHWTLNLEGFNYEGTYNASTTYLIGDVVSYTATAYVMLQDRVVGVTPGTDVTKWDVLSQGDSAAVLNVRGDIIIRTSSQTNRLALGASGSYLKSDGTDISWDATTATGHFQTPVGTTAQRPGTPSSGGVRFNTSVTGFEGYSGAAWMPLGPGNPWTTETADFNVAANDRVLVDTTSGAITATLPTTPLVGDVIRFQDLSGTFSSNDLTIDRNGKDIMNLAEDMTVNTDHAGFGLVFTGDTNGWKIIEVA